MITIIILLLMVILIVIEIVSLWGNRRPLQVDFDVDTTLVEPQETATLYYTVTNPHRIPLLFVGLSLYLEPDASVREDKEFIRTHVSRHDTGTNVKHSFFLPARSRFSGKLHISLSRRGIHDLGKYFLETGDFLGFQSRVTSERISADITVMPKLCTDEPVLKILGDYIGDISVRRFIIEDPVLTLGYLDYTGREPMKKIAWKHSAKVGRLMVKNNDYTVDANAAVVLNMASGSPEEKEKCLEIVRTVCERLEKEQIPYQFLSNGDAGNLREGFGKKHFDHLMTNLGRSALFSYSSFDSLIERCIRERKRSLSHFIISAPLTAQDRDALVRLQRYSEYELCVLEAEVNRDAAC
jgi:hypothetical protein